TSDETKSFGDRLIELKNKAQVALEPLGKMLLNLFEQTLPHVEKFANWLVKLSRKFENLGPKAKKAIVTIGGISAAIGPALIAIGSMSTELGKITDLFSKFIPKLGGTKKGLLGLTGPIGLTITIIAGLVAGFVTAYNKSETFRNVVNRLKDAFLNAVSGIKEFLTTNPQIQAFLNGMKTGFQTMKTHVSNAIGTVVSFFKEKIAQMKAFWDSNGTQILQAFRNVFNSIKTVVSPVMNFLMAIFRKTFPILKTILGGAFKAMLAIAKSVWGNIKGVVNGGLQFIQGLIKTFSGLFTGDFSKMWEGIKDIFSGAIKFLWNFVQVTCFGKLIKGAKLFIKPFKSGFSKMWNGIKNIFSTVINWIVSFVKKMFNGMKNTVSSINNGIKNVINKVWNAI